MPNHSPGIKSSFVRAADNGASFPNSDKERSSSKKKNNLSDFYETSHGLKRRLTPNDIAEMYSFKKTVRDLKQETQSEDEETFGSSRCKSDDLSSSLLSSSLTPPSMRPSEPLYSNFSQSLSVPKSSQHFTSPSMHLNSATQKHSSLSTVSSIPANQLRAHVNRADAEEITDLEELEKFAKTFKQRRIKLGLSFSIKLIAPSLTVCAL